MGNGQNNTVHLTNSAPKRFVPTCTICGNQHWPRDPSCAGKKGAKAKAKAKGVLKAKARAKRMGTAAADTSQPAEASGTEMLPASSPAVTFPATPNVSPKPSASTHPATPTGPGTPTFPAKPTVPATPKVSSPPVETSYPGAKTYFAQPAQPAGEPVSPPQQNTVAKPQPQKQPGGETVFKIKAKSKEEITSFTDEIARIKRQADEVVLRTSEDAAHRVQAERTARINAEEKALNEAAARLKAEQKLQAEIDKLKNLQEEARLAVQANQMQMQEIQAQFSDVNTNNDAAAAIRPFEESADATAIPIAPGHSGCNTATLLAIRAREIIETNVIQVSAEDTISWVLDQMLARDSYYAVVAGEDQIDGIVSRADLTGPVSEYLKPLIAKWQRSGSDATYNLAIKWIMSRKVNTIDADASCTAIMKNMRDLNMCPLLVVEDGHAIGLVTPFNVFKIRALLKLESDSTSSTNRELIEALPERISSYLNELNAAKTTQQQPEAQTQG